MPSERAMKAAAERVGETVGHRVPWLAAADKGACLACRAERAARAEITALVERAVREEREACAKIVDAKMDKLHEMQRIMEQDAESGEEHASGISELALAAETEAMLCFELSEEIRSRIEPARGGDV